MTNVQLEKANGILTLEKGIVKSPDFKSPRNERIFYLRLVDKKSYRAIANIIKDEYGDDLSMQRVSEIFNDYKAYLPTNL